MEVIENIALITINATLVFQLISFLLFLFILNRIMIRPLRNVMGERESLLERISEDIVVTQQKYRDIEKEIEAQEIATRKTAFSVRNEIESSGHYTADDILERARDEINKMKAKTQRETASQLAAARQEIEKEANIISDQMIAVLLERRSAA